MPIEQKPLKVAIYLRTSKTEQILDNQRIPLENYAASQQWDYHIFEEKESTRNTRPIQQELLNQLLKKEYDVLLIYKFDRWARSSRELVNHMEQLTERKVRFISYTENIDLGTSTGKLMFQIIAAFAEFERNLIRERTIAGLERARAWGKKLGRPRKQKTPPVNHIEDYISNLPS